MVDRRLGRGLDFFLSGGKNAPATPPAATRAPAPPPGEDTTLADISALGPSPFQPRKDIDAAELEQLAQSIRASGILQPILVRRVGERFEIVAGERRWRAAKIAGLEQVPVLVRAISDDESAVFGLVENIQREDLNAIEKAAGFRLLMQKLGATQEEVAKRVGMDRSSVANFVRLLDLPGAVQAHVSRGTLTMGHARTLLALPDPDTQTKVADEAIRQGWSVRMLEAQVKAILEPGAATPASAKPSTGSKSRPVWLNELEETLRDTLATPVTIKYSRNRSQIVIDCAGREEFERLYQRVKNC